MISYATPISASLYQTKEPCMRVVYYFKDTLPRPSLIHKLSGIDIVLPKNRRHVHWELENLSPKTDYFSNFLKFIA